MCKVTITTVNWERAIVRWYLGTNSYGPRFGSKSNTCSHEMYKIGTVPVHSLPGKGNEVIKL